MKCKCCGKERDLRFGFCFDCVEAESIIAEGKDMYEEEMAKEEMAKEEGLSKHMMKVKHLIKKGWQFGKDANQQTKS